MKINVGKDTIQISEIEIRDQEIVNILSETEESKREELILKAFKVGLIALKNASTAGNVDYVEKEFSKFKAHVENTLENVKKDLDDKISGVFEEDGIFPQVLKEYLGEGGKLNDLFDENKRDSAMGKLSDILKRHFDGDNSIIYKMLDSGNPSSPLYTLKKELVEKVENIEKALKIKEAVSEAEEKSTAKGFVFQDLVLEKINDIAKILDDNVIDVGNMRGKILNSKAGDILSKLNLRFTSGNKLKIILEAKDQSKTLPSILKELEEAMLNRDAQVAIAVFSSQINSPRESGNFRVYPGGKIICVLDKDTQDSTALEVAYKYSRIEALSEIKITDRKINTTKLESSLSQIRSKLNSVSTIKSSLSSIGSGIEKTKDSLEELRLEIFSIVEEMSEEISKEEDTEPVRETLSFSANTTSEAPAIGKIN